MNRQFVSFEVGGERFGFDIRLIKEITSSTHITPVPRKVSDVAGVVNLRGQVVVVLDIGLSLGKGAQPVTDDSQILVLKTTGEIELVVGFVPDFDVAIVGAIPVGFLVESVGELLTVPAEQIEAAPSHLVARYRQFVVGVVRQAGLPMVILSVGALLEVGS